MLYLYIDRENNRLHCVSKTRFKSGHTLNPDGHEELMVPDDFVYQKPIVDPDGKQTVEDMTAQEILDSIGYSQLRAIEYPSYADQFDILYHGGYDAWKAEIDKIKNKYPKPQ